MEKDEKKYIRKKARNQGNGATKGNSSKNLREREKIKKSEAGREKEGPKQRGTHKTFDKEIVGLQDPRSSSPHPLLALEKAADPSEPHDRIRIRYQESVTKFSAAAFVGLH